MLEANISFAEAILKAQDEVMAEDESVILIGEGVPDPKAIFNTTKGLKLKYPTRVFDSPVSEAGVTGICIGAALNGLKPIHTHQRMDFSLYAMDQIVNNASKWHSMFGFQRQVPMVIRMVVGRGWGQGNQHSQNLTALYAHIPNLKVFIPYDPASAYRLFKEAIKEPGPVIFVEHKWLYNMRENLNLTKQDSPDLTIISSGPSSYEAQQAITHLEGHLRIDHLTLDKTPFDLENIKTPVMVIDDAWGFCGLSAEIMAQCTELGCFSWRLTYPNHYTPSSHIHSEGYYKGRREIIESINKHWSKDYPLPNNHPVHDVDPFSKQIGTGI